jgi:chloramphenicol O-acetyltransferase type B
MQLKMLLIAFKRYLNNKKIIAKSFFFKRLNKTSYFGVCSVLFHRCHIRNSNIGKYTYFAGGAEVNNANIGGFCSIADGVKIGVGTHPVHYISTHPIFYSESTIFPYRLLNRQTLSMCRDFSESKPINIGHDVWIGANVIILDGVTIGNGAIIGAGAVVTKNIDDYAIVGGVPATLIKYRKVPDKIKGINWWDLENNQLVSFWEAFHADNSTSINV